VPSKKVTVPEGVLINEATLATRLTALLRKVVEELIATLSAGTAWLTGMVAVAEAAE
jgi:hypothetical protein